VASRTSEFVNGASRGCRRRGSACTASKQYRYPRKVRLFLLLPVRIGRFALRDDVHCDIRAPGCIHG
jgi:hypothetical protein